MERAMRTTVDRFGRVVVPKAMRERLGLRAGTEIEIEAAEGHLSLRPVEDSSPLIVKQGILVFAGAALGDLEAAVATDREERGRRLAGVSSR
jgi:AbrB family looped-hinge helix DNA binding protein